MNKGRHFVERKKQMLMGSVATQSVKELQRACDECEDDDYLGGKERVEVAEKRRGD